MVESLTGSTSGKPLFDDILTGIMPPTITYTSAVPVLTTLEPVSDTRIVTLWRCEVSRSNSILLVSSAVVLLMDTSVLPSIS